MSFLQSLHTILPMNMASLSFVYVYLPISLLACHIAPKPFKTLTLLLASLGFYALSHPDSLMLAAASTLMDYAMIWGVVALKRPAWRRGFLLACIAKNAAILICLSASDNVPLFFAVMCVSGIDCALETFREENPKPRGFIRVALYIMFFPRLYAGPLMKYGDFCAGLDSMGFDGRECARGLGAFAAGALKYAFLGRELFWLHSSLRQIPATESNLLSAWLLVLSFMLSLYFTLSGLCDMARGISRMLGFELPQNFYYPYQSRSVSDFYWRFNMTVSGFLQRAVYKPISSLKGGFRLDSAALLLCGALWGAWFGFKVNYIVWGLLAAVFLILEKYAYPGALRKIPTLFCRVYSICASIAGFAIFMGDTLSHSLEILRLMLGFGDIPSLSGQIDRVLYALLSNWALIVCSCLLATSLLSLAVGFLRRLMPGVSAVLSGVAGMGLLILFTAFTLGGGYV